MYKRQQLICACTTPVVHAVANCYTPTIIQIYEQDCAWVNWEDGANKGNPLYEFNIRQLNTTENIQMCIRDRRISPLW